jgi:gas vesicle protein
MRTLGRFFIGLLLGGITGSALALLFAPLSGEEMRTRIKDNVYYVRNEVETAAKQRSEELKLELAKLQKKI